MSKNLVLFLTESPHAAAVSGLLHGPMYAAMRMTLEAYGLKVHLMFAITHTKLGVLSSSNLYSILWYY
jgi:hypothetical protein